MTSKCGSFASQNEIVTFGPSICIYSLCENRNKIPIGKQYRFSQNQHDEQSMDDFGVARDHPV